VYAWIENYREVWQKDGYKAAEIMIKTVADTTPALGWGSAGSAIS